MGESLFIQLLRVAIGKQFSVCGQWPEQQWADVVNTAKKQSLLGIVAYAASILPEDEKPPRQFKIQLALLAETIQEKNKLLSTLASEIYRRFISLGVRTCLLKGQGVAMLYPCPDFRQPGDIDLWIEGDRREIMQCLSSNFQIGNILYHHADLKVFKDKKVEVEAHFTPNWMYSPFANRRLQRYFRENSAAQFSNFLPDEGFAKPTIGFDTVYSLVHIYRHLLLEGVGLRQIMDYYFILVNSSAKERTDAFTEFKRLKMTRFVSAVMYIMKELFLIDDEYLLCPANEKAGAFLLDEIMKSGNFGINDDRNKYRTDQSLPVRIYNRMSYLFRYYSLTPSEVLWAPFFKAYQSLWRRVNGY